MSDIFSNPAENAVGYYGATEKSLVVFLPIAMRAYMSSFTLWVGSYASRPRIPQNTLTTTCQPQISPMTRRSSIVPPTDFRQHYTPTLPHMRLRTQVNCTSCCKIEHMTSTTGTYPFLALFMVKGRATTKVPRRKRPFGRRARKASSVLLRRFPAYRDTCVHVSIHIVGWLIR